MTKRIKEHQLEDLSRAKYSLAIPNHWVYRDKDKDYGIDSEVEIFDENGKATGLVYWVQLKATESKVEAKAKKIDLSIESIKYYKKLDIPVLIARYSKIEDCFYYKWIHEIDLYYAKKNAKTLRVTFSNDDKWDEKSPDQVKRYLEKIRIIKDGLFKLPISISFIVKNNVINNVPRAILISSFRIAINKFSDFIKVEDDPINSLLLVTLADDELVISLSSVVGCTFHGINEYNTKNFPEDLVVSSLLGFAITLSQVGQLETMARIVFDKRIKKGFFKNQKILFRLLPLALSTSYFGVALDSVTELIENEQDNILEIITGSAVLFETNSEDYEKSNRIETFLNKVLEKYLAIGENTQIGICHYNLGNHYRNRELDKKAIYHYLRARKFEEKYLNQIYYYQELGGSLFHYGKYNFSAAMYKIAIEKGAPQSVKPLYADALMHSGNYQLAFELFSAYIKSSKEENDVWRLKTICLEVLINNYGIKRQTRKRREALNIVDISKANDANFVKQLEAALEKDYLCGLAWFNLRIVQNKEGKNEDAVLSFTFCGLLQTRDLKLGLMLYFVVVMKEKQWLFFH